MQADYQILYPYGPKGGMRVFFVPHKNSTDTVISVQVLCGEAHAPIGKPEVAHLLEHLIVQSPTVTGKTLVEISQEFFENSKAETGAYDMHFTADFDFEEAEASEQNHLFLSFFLKALFDAELDKTKLNQEQQVLIKEIENRAPHDANALKELKAFKLPEHYTAYYKATPKDVEALTLKDCRSFYEEVFCKAPVEIVLQGAFDKGECLNLIKANIQKPSLKLIDEFQLPQLSFKSGNLQILTDARAYGNGMLHYLWLTHFVNILEKEKQHAQPDFEVVAEAEYYESCTLYSTNLAADHGLIESALSNLSNIEATDFTELKKNVLNQYEGTDSLTYEDFQMIEELNQIDFETFGDFLKKTKTLMQKT